MKHYHGTPLGGTRDVIARFITGRHGLIPFPRQEDLEIVAEASRSFIFDNGAFSIWKKGGVLDIDGYIKWCGEWYKHPGFDWALIPDVIDGTDNENDDLLKSWPKEIPGVPVYHMHEDVKRLEKLSKEWPIVALGSSGVWATPGSVGWWRRMATMMEAVCDDEGRPNCKLHGLRMLDPNIFTRLPLASSDSTNVAQNKAIQSRWRGPYAPPTQWQRAVTIADRVEAQNSSPVFVFPQDELQWNGPNGILF